jgi:hypothetical protein
MDEIQYKRKIAYLMSEISTIRTTVQTLHRFYCEADQYEDLLDLDFYIQRVQNKANTGEYETMEYRKQYGDLSNRKHAL